MNPKAPAAVILGPGLQRSVDPTAALILGDAQEELGNVQLTAAESFESLAMETSEWDGAVERLGGSIYMTWDWLRTWWAFYGQGCALRLLVFRREGEIIGLLPLYLQQLGLPPFHLTVARLVGANIPPKVFDPPIDREATFYCVRMALYYLEQEGCGVVSLGPVSDEFAIARSGLEEPGGRLAGWRVRKQRGGVYSWFPLPESYAAYLSSLGKNEQKNRRRYELRMLRREHEVAIDVLGRSGEALDEAFAEFVRLHTAQWRSEGLPGHFGAWPRGLEYNRALVQAQAPHRRVRMLCIRADCETVCAEYSFAWRDRWFAELPARKVGPPWDVYSLGSTGIVVMIQEAIREGKKRIEGGLGHYPYKLRLGAVERPVWIYRFARRRPGDRVRQWAAQTMRLVTQLSCHKIWYRRIQPRLPERWHKPQAWVWLRYDF